jgi:hypothetical protein
MNLQRYTFSHIESYLTNYEVLVRDLAEVAEDWPSLEQEEQNYHKAVLMQVWGNRKALGSLYQGRRLTLTQQNRLAELDSLLLQQASLMELCYGFDLSNLLIIFRWGTPLSKSTRTVRMEVRTTSLNRMALALAS